MFIHNYLLVLYRNCSILEQFFLKALRDETIRSGFDYSTIESVYVQMKSICLFEGKLLYFILS